MQARYPNLELLEYMVSQSLAQSEEFKERLKAAKEKNKWTHIRFEAIVFPQTWSNTCTGFDVDKDGNAMWGGQAFTDEYTSVFHEKATDTYTVCFGNKPCYMVTNAPQAFYDDLQNRRMVSLSESKKRYDNDKEEKEKINEERED